VPDARGFVSKTDTSFAGLIAIAMLPVTVHAALQIASNSSVSRRHVSCF